MLLKSPLFFFMSPPRIHIFLLICSNCFRLHFTYLNDRDPEPRAGRRYSGFKVTGMIEGFWGFEIFDSRILGGKGYLASIFSGSMI